MNRDSPLLRLPAELRNTIYSMCLDDVNTSPHGVSIPRRNLAGRRWRCKEPPLLQICKQITEEATPIYYGDHRFVFNGPFHYGAPIWPVLKEWLTFIGPAKRNLLHCVRLSNCETVQGAQNNLKFYCGYLTKDDVTGAWRYLAHHAGTRALRGKCPRTDAITRRQGKHGKRYEHFDRPNAKRHWPHASDRRALSDVEETRSAGLDG